jgi:ADP-ribose pyrophosphatase
MQDKDEGLKDTVARELKEETNLDLDFSLAEDIYSGYVDDSRNTKNAWIETKALHYRLSEEEKETINPVAGDDAKDIK